MSTNSLLGAEFASGNSDRGAETATRFGTLRRRWIAIGIVGAVHVALLWALAVGIRPVARMGSVGSEVLQIQFLSPNLQPPVPPAPPLDWEFDTPEAVLVPEPQIIVASDRGATGGIVGTAVAQVLPPRLDPQHLNGRPQLPHTMGSIIAALSLELRILVLADGSVGNAEVTHSSGEDDVDRLAVDTVRNSWRYLPASINGKPIAAWTTVIVRFAAF